MMKHDVSPELDIRTSRSGGKGGQHVNKVETQVEVRFHIPSSRIFSEQEKQVLLVKLAKRLTKDDVLIVRCNETRTQLSNKEIAINKLHVILEHALEKRQPRIATKVPKGVKARRLEGKKLRGEIKAGRKKIAF
jgi:ribosome-associated protein